MTTVTAAGQRPGARRKAEGEPEMCDDPVPTILIVEDDPLVLEAAAAQVRMWGYNVVGCCSAIDGLDVLAKGGIDVVLSDIKMPGISGTEFLGIIRNSAPDIPVILMTAYGDLDVAIEAVRSGATDFILKPFKPGYLRQAVGKAIRYRQLLVTEKKYLEVLKAKVRESEENLKAAGLIQQSLLPVAAPLVASFDFAWRFLPCQRVGGDLYNVFWLDETNLGIYVLDVGGHGVAAAMVATAAAQALDPFSGRLLKSIVDTPPHYGLVSPGRVLAALNEIFPLERFDRLLTICYLILEPGRGRVRYSNAALPLPLLIRAGGAVETLGKGGTILGIGEEARYEEGEIFMRKGDRLFLYTDGIVDHFDHKGEFYGSKRLLAALKKQSAGETLQGTCDRVLESVLSFGGAQRPADDITLLAMECRPSAEVSSETFGAGDQEP